MRKREGASRTRPADTLSARSQKCTHPWQRVCSPHTTYRTIFGHAHTKCKQRASKLCAATAQLPTIAHLACLARTAGDETTSSALPPKRISPSLPLRSAHAATAHRAGTRSYATPFLSQRSAAPARPAPCPVAPRSACARQTRSQCPIHARRPSERRSKPVDLGQSRSKPCRRT